MIDIELAVGPRPRRFLAETPTPSGWAGLECVLADLLDRFRVQRHSALEFGVEHGFSTVALSNYFDRVCGVDHFQGDEHAGLTPTGVDRYRDTSERLRPYSNILLFKMSWQRFTISTTPDARFDLIHVDAKHDFYTTYVLGTWAAQHSDVVLVHDTLPFPDVAPACNRICDEQGMTPYNWPHSNGLGILVRERVMLSGDALDAPLASRSAAPDLTGEVSQC